MKLAILLLVVASVSYAQVSPLTKVVPVPFISRSEVRDDYGQYSLSYRTADGIGVSEQGVLKPNSEGKYVLVKQGTYTYLSPDGTPVTLNYVADENGFQPSGKHLPKSVPLPENPTN
ncbi:endocuticle structural glycoprotein ABD-5-like [Cimex lectularius]|uniref:CPR type cuticle protein n=1 Tax=Cimex lectularius TaxID=79782 RepID=A0A8I6SAF9_CIMLE|nr:endocuticle structural glycoprotein ABD-5-like [Cimex lectularius]